MIKSISHKGLRLFFEAGRTVGIRKEHAARLQMQLIALQTANVIADMNLPGYRLHRLKGKYKSRWSIKVNKNWRLTFEFTDGDVFLLDYEDYH